MFKRQFGFSPFCRLRKTDEFSSVFAFKCIVHSEHFQVYAKPRETARLGLIVAKRIQKTAVGRNKMRRFIRECFRLQQHTWQADFIVRIKKSFVNNLDRVDCHAELLALLDKANQKCQPKS